MTRPTTDGGIQATTAADDADAEPGLFQVDPKWFKIGFYVFLLLWLVYLLWETTTYERFEDFFFPYVVGVPILLLTVLQLLIFRYPTIVARLTPDRQSPSEGEGDLQQRLAEATETSSRPKAEREKYELVMIAWVVALPFMMFYIGMGWTLILYVFGFTWYFVRDLKTAVSVTAVVVVFVYILFIRFLDMIIWFGEFGLADPLVYLDDLFDLFL